MDGSNDLRGAEEDMSSNLNSSDFCASCVIAPAESFKPHINHPIVGLDGLLQGLTQMKKLDLMTFPTMDDDVPTKMDKSLLKLLNGCSLGIIDATIENPYILPDVEVSWIRPRLRKCCIADSNQEIPAIMNGAEDIFSKMVEIDPPAENQNNSLKFKVFLEMLFARNFLRLKQDSADPKDIQVADRRLLNKPFVQLRLFKDMTAWKENDWPHIEIWKKQGMPIYYILLCDKITNELIVQIRLAGDWQVASTASNKSWTHFNYAVSPGGILERLGCTFSNARTAQEFVDVTQTCVAKRHW
ncbi:GL25106 [Drosophila persimilis]|uniref:GL25106 n=1 Tax=Drosophila persimilis TaxID=7234 RepID=B4GQW0_DROPE|nr:GL25106 [Drosophila persimilis]